MSQWCKHKNMTPLGFLCPECVAETMAEKDERVRELENGIKMHRERTYDPPKTNCYDCCEGCPMDQEDIDLALWSLLDREET